MATFRVVLDIQCDRDTIRHKLGGKYLAELRQDAGYSDYVASYVEHELGWLDQSFERVQVVEIKRLGPILKSKRRQKDSP